MANFVVGETLVVTSWTVMRTELPDDYCEKIIGTKLIVRMGYDRVRMMTASLHPLSVPAFVSVEY